MANYTQGSVYDKNRFDVKKEIVPSNPFFKALEKEEMVYEEREKPISFYHITSALERGEISDLDKVIISLIATFGSCCMTKRSLTELLTLLGVDYNSNRIVSIIARLHRLHLINIAHFKKAGEPQATTQIIILTNHGSQLAKSFGIVHRFNAINMASMTVATAKARCQTTQLIVNFLKNIDLDCFKVRPVIVKNPDEGAIVRPAASIAIRGEYINIEVPRREDEWMENLMEKLNRYKLVFPPQEMPSVIINGEDEEMNREIFIRLRSSNNDMEIMFTDDLATFGVNFRYSLYSFAEDGSKLHFEFVE